MRLTHTTLAIALFVGGCKESTNPQCTEVGPQKAEFTNLNTGEVFHYERGVTGPLKVVSHTSYSAHITEYYNEPCKE